MTAPHVEREELLQIIEAGIDGPTGDNCQPWKVALREDGFDLWLVPEAAHSYFDLGDYASWLACGGFLENARLAAAGRGLSATWTIAPDPSQPTLWARVTLSPVSGLSRDELASAIRDRHANRSPFEPSPISDSQARALESQGSEAGKVVVVHDPTRLKKLRELVAFGERVRARSREAHESTRPWFRWTAAQAETSRDGLDARVLGISAGQRVALRALQPWSLMWLSGCLGGARMMGHYAGALIERAGGVGVVASRSLCPADVVAAGQALERAWLRATLDGLGFSVLGALTLFALRVEEGKGGEFPARDQESLKAASGELRALFGLRAPERALVLFRVGRAPRPALVSLRRPVASFLQQGGAP
ncbi:MAG: hypothetical protein HY901_01085 [Deltaproteobacteria bacterium]|nr:hypothetical protein [Deltaproteobacteria bacterium]